MNALVRNEFAKMRRLHVRSLVALLLIGIAGTTVFYSMSSGLLTRLDSPDAEAWKMLFAGVAMASSLITPILLAVVASRQVEIEHSGNGWISHGAAGLSPGALCRAKFCSLAILVSTVTIVAGLLVVCFGVLAGIDVLPPAERWACYLGALVVINLVVLAFHIVLSAKIENQLVCIGVGLLGVFFAVFGEVLPRWLAHLIPWGYYSLTTQADYVGEDLVYFDLPAMSIAALAVVGGGLFYLVTIRFDRQED